MKMINLYVMAVSLLVVIAGCKSYPLPEGAVAVKPFDVDRYMGTWYEIARFDLRFERNLNNTTATYSLNEDGSVKVTNRGFNYVKGQWKETVGKAKFVGDSKEARLKVSFFGPFYGGYNVIALDPDYTYALIAGSSLDYLWILARTKTIPEELKQEYIRIAREIGFNTDELIWVEHDK